MDPALLPFLVGTIVALGLFVAVMIFLGRPKTEPTTELDRQLAAVAAAHEGLSLRLGTRLESPVLEGTFDGVPVRVTEVPARGGDGNAVLEIRLPSRGMPPSVVARPSPMGVGPMAMASVPGARPLRTGDPVFDREHVLRTADPAGLLARMGPEARTILQTSIGATWRHEAGAWVGEVRQPSTGQVALSVAFQALGAEAEAPAAPLPELIAQGVALVRATELEGTVAERLAGLAEHDPSPGVRGRAMELAVAHGEVAPSLLRRLAGGDGPEAVVAAAALGDEGEAHLVRLMGLRAVRRQGALAAAMQGDALSPGAREATQAALLQELAEKRGQLQVIDALGAIGDVGAVPTLRQARDIGVLYGREAERRADAAVRAIQARAEGAQAGQVSLASAGSAGRLAVASGRRQVPEG